MKLKINDIVTQCALSVAVFNLWTADNAILAGHLFGTPFASSN